MSRITLHLTVWGFKHFDTFSILLELVIFVLFRILKHLCYNDISSWDGCIGQTKHGILSDWNARPVAAPEKLELYLCALDIVSLIGIFYRGSPPSVRYIPMEQILQVFREARGWLVRKRFWLGRGMFRSGNTATRHNGET